MVRGGFGGASGFGSWVSFGKWEEVEFKEVELSSCSFNQNQPALCFFPHLSQLPEESRLKV